MTAEDHLSGQFEVIRSHRSVRIGERTYPAVFTSSDENPHLRHAVIPTENGGLLSITHIGDEPRADINAPYLQTAGKQEDRDSIKAKGNQDLFGTVGSGWGVKDTQQGIDTLSRVKIHPEAVANNQRMIHDMRKVFHDGED